MLLLSFAHGCQEIIKTLPITSWSLPPNASSVGAFYWKNFSLSFSSVEFPYSNPYDQAVLANSQSTSMVTSNAYDQVVLANDLPMQAQMTPQTKRSHMVPKKKPSWTTQPLMTKVAYHFTILHYICISNTVSPSFNSWYKSWTNMSWRIGADICLCATSKGNTIKSVS